MFDQFYTTLESLGIVPVVVLDKVEDAAPLAHALMAAGMKSAEVTFRTACATECIAAMAEAEPEMCVGAGTVLTVEQVEPVSYTHLLMTARSLEASLPTNSAS